MWYEILPSAGIILVALAVPGYATFYLNKAVFGNAFRRNLDFRWDRHMMQRDERLTGNAYKQNGLDAIPDK